MYVHILHINFRKKFSNSGRVVKFVRIELYPIILNNEFVIPMMFRDLMKSVLL